MKIYFNGGVKFFENDHGIYILITGGEGGAKILIFMITRLKFVPLPIFRKYQNTNETL